MGLYLWTTHDYSVLMNQLSNLQASVNSVLTQLMTVKNNQAAMSSSIQAMQLNILSGFSKLTTQEAQQMAALDDLTAQVKQNTDLEQSAITLITGLAQQIQDAVNSGDQAALTNLASQLSASAQKLSEAITANTASAPASGA